MDSILFAIDNHVELAENIILKCNDKGDLNLKLGEQNEEAFSDGELCVDFKSSVRGKRVYLLSSPHSSDEIIKLELAIDAAKRSGAKEIIPVLPYFPYARQDKKDQVRGPIGAKLMALKLEAIGSTAIITYDLHADQIQGFFEIPVTHIDGKNVFDEHIQYILTPNTVFCGPDAGSGKRVKRVKTQIQDRFGINIPIVMMDKTRKEANKIDEMVIIGDVTGKDVIILDDMVDTAGTLCKAADVLLESGAKSVRAIISHPVLSGKAYANIAKSNLTQLVVSDSLSLKDTAICTADEAKAFDKIKVISVADQIAMAIFAIDRDHSYEALKKTQTYAANSN